MSDMNIRYNIHDYLQFESVFSYDLQTKNDTDKNYEIDMYFFIPQSIGIEGDSYEREDFYTSLTNYLRISHSTKEEFLLNGIFPLLDKYINKHLVTQKRQQLAESVIQEIKLFGFRFNQKLKEIKHTMQKEQSPVVSAQFLEKELKNITDVLECYRSKYAHLAITQTIFIDEDVKEALLLIDEYCSYAFEKLLIKVYKALQLNTTLYKLISTIEDTLRKEIDYREKTHFVNLDKNNQESCEYYYYRMGLLKKYISSVLFLDMNNIKKEKKYRNIIAAIGAAFAATWASFSNIQYWQLASSQNNMQFQLITIVALGIVAYIFKDRIKEWTKDYFNEQLKHRLPDFDRQIFYHQYDEKGEKQKFFLGKSIEYVRFLKKSAVPEDVQYIRDMGLTTALEPEKIETVIHYSKKVRLNLKLAQETLNISTIQNLARFDISKFIVKLHNPEKKLYYYDKQNGIVSIDTPKVYHINIIFRYATHTIKNNKKTTSKIEFERLRIILNKKGIVRLEEVVSRGQMSYLEVTHD